MNTPLPPVITIDGPTASGKGTVAALIATKLGYHYLDSGAIYRALGVMSMQLGLKPDNPCDLEKIIALSSRLPVLFVNNGVFLNGTNLSETIRTEAAGVMASQLAAVPEVREGLLQRQKDFRKTPGLVADGRDMASVVFPDAKLKIFLTANTQVRAERRAQQIKARGQTVDFQTIYNDLMARDKRDSERIVAPLKPSPDSLVLDCSNMPIEEVLTAIYQWAQERI